MRQRSHFTRREVKRFDRYSRLLQLVVILWVVSLTIMVFTALHAQKAASGIMERREIVASLETLRAEIAETENAVRSFIASGLPDSLSGFRAKAQQFREQLSLFGQSPARTTVDRRDLALLSKSSREYIEALESAVESHRSGGVGIDIMSWSAGSSLGRMRESLAQVQQHHLRDAEALERQEKRAAGGRLATIVLTLLANFAFLGWSFLRMRQEVLNRTDAAREANEQKDLLQITLLSIGDAVVITDHEGDIVLVNHAAERLTGWSSSESLGRPCNEVVRLIQEDTRVELPCIVASVLRGESVTEPAGLRLLMTRDGMEMPVERSVAPVRGSDGTPRGVVIVLRDFTEHRKVQRELMAASAAKDHFIAMLSHELRTPLAPALLQTEALVADQQLGEEARARAEAIARHIRLEARLIGDLLDLTDISRGELTLKRETFDLHTVLDRAVDVAMADLQGKRIDIRVGLGATEHWVNGDETRLQQVFWNLIKNAVRFTPERGRVMVRSSNPGPGRVEIIVEDSGTGISSENLARIFHPFEQVVQESATPGIAGGLGLGLSISRALVELHGGRITASSLGLGAGSAFMVELTTVPAPPPVVRPVRVPRTSTGRERILLVEDHAPTLAVLSMLLEREGYTVGAAESIATALNRAGEQPYDLLISDLGLPDGHGTTLLRRLRERGCDFPAIAVSGYGQQEDRKITSVAGFAMHLVKPIDLPELKEAIARCMSGETSDETVS